MLITLNDLGKFCYKSINYLIASLGRRWKWLRRIFARDTPNKLDDAHSVETGNAIGAATPPPQRVSFNLRCAAALARLNTRGRRL